MARNDIFNRTYAELNTNSSLNIKFLHGPQSNINDMMINGGAIEGAFYLSDETQKLYVGRKSGNEIYPVQVSRGVTIVTDANQLANLNLNIGNNVDEGDLYYAIEDNILAAFHYNASAVPPKYEWQQLNPPTGISSISFNPIEVSNNFVRESLSISTAAGPQSTNSFIVGGDNVTITAIDSASSSYQYQGSNVPVIQVNAHDTTYAIGTEENSPVIKLTSSENVVTNVALNNNNNGSIVISENNGTIMFNGPTLSSFAVANAESGFVLTATMTQGDDTPVAQTGRLNPTISYGNAAITSVFENGIASLNVYTQAETDALITSKLQTADALSYKGVFDATDISNTATQNTWINSVIANGGFHPGDVYKVKINTGSDQVYIGEERVKSGDLIIVNQDGINNFNTFKTGIDIVPSGDELELSIALNKIGSDAISGGLLTFNDTNQTQATPIYNLRVLPGSKIDIGATQTQTTSGTLTIAHEAITTTLSNNASIGIIDDTNLNGPATFDADETFSFFALAPNVNDAFSYDNFGHITNISGRQINFRHNKLESMSSFWAVDSNNVGRAMLTVKDQYSSAAVNTNIYMTSQTLKLNASADNSSISFDLVWGSF